MSTHILSFLAVVLTFSLASAATEIATLTLDVKKCGVIGDGVADDTAAIQKALTGGQRTVVIPPGTYKVTAALKVDSGTTIQADPNAIIRLADGADTNAGVFLLTNRDPAGGNAYITVEGGIWDGNNEHNPRGRDGDPNGYTGTAINFVNVRHLALRNLTIRNPEAFSIRLGQVEDFVVEDIRFDHTVIRPNQDGVHVGGFCQRGVIRKLRALTPRTTNDDMVALNADDATDRVINLGMKRGPIRDITVENLRAEDAYTFVRMLSFKELIENVTISDVSGGCRVHAINLDRWRFPAGGGNIRNVTLRNFTVRKLAGGDLAKWSNAAPLIPIQSSVHGLRIENFRREPADDLPAPTLVVDNGRQNRLSLEGATGESTGNKFVLPGGGFALLTLDFPSDGAHPVAPALVRTATWTESWPDAAGQPRPREVRGEIWNDAIQAALAKDNAVHLPKRDQPYYLDGPVILKSGQKLTADAGAEIRLKPGSNTCMVRNEHIVGFADKAVPDDTQPDADITIEGGIWTTLANGAKDNNGNQRGYSSKQNPVPGTHGVILLHNVRKVRVRNVTVRQSRPFALHLGNIRNFTIDGLTLDRHGRDGVHVDGPASDGVIRNVSGDSHDDPVSLTAWDWRQYNVTFGSIHHVTIEHITGAPEGKHSTDAIRLLPGVKRFSDGTTLDCPIHDITLRHITDIRDFKLYDQPNLEVGRDKDFSAGIGTLKDIVFENLTFNRPGSIQVHANTDGLTIREVKLLFAPSADYHLLELGPKSATYQGAPGTDPAKWTEIFSPDLDCTVRNVSISSVRTGDSQTDLPIDQVVRVIEQILNPDYPKTTPKGGTGKGIWIR